MLLVVGDQRVQMSDFVLKIVDDETEQSTEPGTKSARTNENAADIISTNGTTYIYIFTCIVRSRPTRSFSRPRLRSGLARRGTPRVRRPRWTSRRRFERLQGGGRVVGRCRRYRNPEDDRRRRRRRPTNETAPERTDTAGRRGGRPLSSARTMTSRNRVGRPTAARVGKSGFVFTLRAHGQRVISLSPCYRGQWYFWYQCRPGR